MSTPAVTPRVLRSRPPTKSRFTQMKNELDLNSVPSGENRNQEGSSAQVLPQVEGPSLPPLVIDVEAIDDDDDDVVVISSSSSRAFPQAGNNTRRNRRTPVVDVELESTRPISKKRRTYGQTFSSCENYMNLEGNYNSNSKTKQAMQPPPPPSPPKELTFTCPICMAPLVEEMSTKCGHIFCKKCIKAAITAQKKCPTCRKNVTAKELIRVFLPASS